MARVHRLNRLQFSLRAMLVITLLVAMYVSYLVRLEANRSQLVREIKAAGGNVTSNESLYSIFSTERITAVTVPYNRIQEIGASRLKALPKLTTLSLTDVDIATDGGGRLKSSEMRITKITNALLDSIDSKSSKAQSR